VAKIFFSYSHQDEAMRDQLELHLTMMKRNGLIETWHDRRIAAGSDLGESIDAQLLAADVVLLLVSPDFLASDYCYSREMAKALERHELGKARVVPVILRSCDWQDSPLGKLLALPKDGRAINLWPDIDVAYLDVVRGLKSLLPTARPEPTATAGPVPESGSAVRAMRSSNLRVRKQFSDADKHRFLRESFDYIQRFFQNSASELQARNPGIEASVTPVTTRQFSALLFRGGKRVSECCITFAQNSMLGGNAIMYSNRADSDGHSCNESLSVETDEQLMYLRPLGMWQLGRERDAKLSQEGGAELFWGIFIEPLQQ
jgi:hypothetical protein